MKQKNWFETPELIGVGGLPITTQGITKRAKKENWQRRRVEGKKGNVFEYYVGDMPESVQEALGFEAGGEVEFPGVGCNLLASKQSSGVDIPFYYTFASAGFGRLNAVKQEPDELVGVSRLWLGRTGLCGGNLLYLLAEGDSMEPSIQSGDLLLVDVSATAPKDGYIYVLRVGDDLLVKRVQRVAGGIRLISDNRSLYEPIDVFFDDAMNIEILGRVVFVGHSLI